MIICDVPMLCNDWPVHGGAINNTINNYKKHLQRSMLEGYFMNEKTNFENKGEKEYSYIRFGL